MIMAPNGLRACEVAGNLVKSAPPPPNLRLGEGRVRVGVKNDYTLK